MKVFVIRYVATSVSNNTSTCILLALTTKAPPLSHSLYPRQPHLYEYFPGSRLHGYEYFPGRSHALACSHATNRLMYGAPGSTGYPLSCLQYRTLGDIVNNFGYIWYPLAAIGQLLPQLIFIRSFTSKKIW